MNVAVLLPTSPFVFGGSEKMADDLVENMKLFGHNARRFDTVFGGNRIRHVTKGILNSHLLRFDDADIVIPIWPTNVGVNHPNVVPWLVGQNKVLYEFYDDPIMGYKRFGAEGEIVRQIIVQNETEDYKKLKRAYTISPHTAKLFKKYNDFEPRVLVLPLEENDEYRYAELGDFVLYHSRIHYQKRQLLAVEAMKYTKSDVKLIVAGADNSPMYVKKIKDTINNNDLYDKVKLIVGRFSEKQKYEWLSHCLAGMYLGENEDYWAIVTTEVMMSKKPIIAPLDTGATKYVVRDGYTGLQPEGTPEAIAETMDYLYNNRIQAKEMGENGNALIRRISPSWEMVVNTLTGGNDESRDCSQYD